ncbi:MAG: hypothetical protein IT204_04820 [Fimbriimonadaceae bacterium]|nr:hypothetical protein [Fimbriimonadaceae bacterium]
MPWSGLLCVFALLAAPPAALPTIYLVGDSTVSNSTAGQQGWGRPFAEHWDPAQVQVVNRARGGRSSRTFLREGLWDQLRALLRPGDWVLLQFGHNDGGGLSDPRRRASLKGNGDETAEVTDPATGEVEVVHTYGWYLRRYVAEAQAAGAAVLVLSPVPRNLWVDGRVARNTPDYGLWSREAAAAAGARWLDLNDLVAQRYEAMGQHRVAAEYFGPTDHTHTTPAGAAVTAAVLAAAMRELPDCPLAGWLRPAP